MMFMPLMYRVHVLQSFQRTGIILVDQNLVGIAQQWFINKIMPLPAAC